MIWYLLIAVTATLALRYLPGVLVDLVRLETFPDSPVLLNRDPCPGDADAEALGWVRLQIAYYDHEVDPSLVVVTINGETAYDGAVGGLQPGWNRDGRGWSGIGDDIGLATLALWEMCALPEVPFASESTVTVEVEYDGTSIGSYSFTVADWAPLHILSVLTIDETHLRIVFDDDARMEGDGDPADALTSSNYTVERLPNDPYASVALEVVGVEADGTDAVIVEFQWEQTPNAPYRVLVENVEDESGNAIENGTADFAGYAWTEPARRNFDIWTWWSTIARRRDDTKDLRRMTSIMQDLFGLILHDVDKFTLHVDPDKCEDRFLPVLLYDVGCPFPWAYSLDSSAQRRLLRILPTLYALHGSAAGLKAVALFFLGLVVTVTPAPANPLGWRLGRSHLGVDTYLFPSTSWLRRSFDLTVYRALTDEERDMLRAIAEYMKPAQMHLNQIHEPGTEPVINHWQLGRSHLGVETTLHGGEA
jgi:phage tail-like protein